MRHRVAGRKLGRNASQRRAMRQAVAVSLFRHESITTTTAKAKEVRRFAERMITLAKKGGLANYRRAVAELQDKAIVKKLFNEIGPRYADRDGGYTRILRLSERRLNDGAEQVVFELVGEERRADRQKAPKKPKVTARRQKQLKEQAKPAADDEPEPQDEVAEDADADAEAAESDDAQSADADEPDETEDADEGKTVAGEETG